MSHVRIVSSCEASLFKKSFCQLTRVLCWRTSCLQTLKKFVNCSSWIIASYLWHIFILSVLKVVHPKEDVLQPGTDCFAKHLLGSLGHLYLCSREVHWWDHSDQNLESRCTVFLSKEIVRESMSGVIRQRAYLTIIKAWVTSKHPS